MRFFTVLLLILFFTICSNPVNAQPNLEENKPNIILFFVDDLGWSDVGFRNPVLESPNIDRLSTLGLNFEQAYIASPTCSPSRATLLTGQHPARLKMVRHIPAGKKHGVSPAGVTSKEFHFLERDPAQFPSRNWLPLETTTYAEALKELGYFNAFVGKWHLGHEDFHPTRQGFDMQIGVSNFGHPKSYYPPYFKTDSILPDSENRYLTDKLTDEAVSFIQDFDQTQPFMLTFSYYSVHSPHEGRTDLVDHFKQKGLADKFLHYAAMLKATDESIGRVMTAVEEKGISDNTILIFLSDQGGFFSNAPLRGGKMKETLFEGGARVPFLFYWPGVTDHRKVTEVVLSTDLFPTLVEIAGGTLNDFQNLDGSSLLPLIKNERALPERAIFGYRAYEDLYVSVRKGDWKMLGYRSGKKQLFNIRNDQSEQRDLASKEHDKLNELLSDLLMWEKEMGVEEYSGFND